jgi:hypothetical protein
MVKVSFLEESRIGRDSPFPRSAEIRENQRTLINRCAQCYVLIMARRRATRQAKRRFHVLKRHGNLKRCLDCRGPSALAMTPHPVLARSAATRQSTRRLSFPKCQSKRKGRVDCRGPSALAMTPHPVIARSVATRQSTRRVSFPRRRSKPKGCLDCRGPAALAMTSGDVIAGTCRRANPPTPSLRGA